MMKKFLSDKIALGTVQFGLSYGINNKNGKMPKKKVFQILKYARQNGIDLLDTAHSYGDSEEIIGEYIKTNPSSFKVISKLSFKKTDDMENIFYNTLKKLSSNKVYGYLVHDFSSFSKNPKVWRFFKKIKKDKKVQKIGFSLYYPSELEYLRKKKIDFDLVQVPYSIFDQRFAESFKWLKKQKVEIHVRSVFLQGLVFKKTDNLPKSFLKIKNKLKKLNSFSKDLEIPISAICLNFAAINSFIDKVIIGIDNMDNLKENLMSLKYEEKIKNIYNKLLKFKEKDENIILPINWKKGVIV